MRINEQCLVALIEVHHADCAFLGIRAGQHTHVFGAVQCADAVRIYNGFKLLLQLECLEVVNVDLAFQDDNDPKSINKICELTCPF